MSPSSWSSSSSHQCGERGKVEAQVITVDEVEEEAQVITIDVITMLEEEE